MQKYFVNIDGQQSGPYSKDDLKLMRINRGTYVWFEGQDHWEEMGSIPELSDLFRSEPPPFKAPTPATPEDQETKGFAHLLHEYRFPIIAGIALLFGIWFTVYTLNSKDDSEASALKKQLEQQQEEAIKQREMLQSQELERQQEEARRYQEELRQKKRQQLQLRLDQAQDKLEEEKAKLEKIEEFHFLRTFAEKEEQVNAQMLIIESWENEVQRLQLELNNL